MVILGEVERTIRYPEPSAAESRDPVKLPETFASGSLGVARDRD
jgi:hypothetical protein